MTAILTTQFHIRDRVSGVLDLVNSSQKHYFCSFYEFGFEAKFRFKTPSPTSFPGYLSRAGILPAHFLASRASRGARS